MPWVQKEYPWDLDCELLSTFREEPQDRTKSCYHCSKGPMVHHYSSRIIDKIFDKETEACHCGDIHTSTENVTSLSNYSYWSENEPAEEDFYDNNLPLFTKTCPSLTDSSD